MKRKQQTLPVRYETTMRLERAVFYNAARLFIDACTLYEAGAYPSSYALGILAMEEVGKVQMLDHVCFETVANTSSRRLDKSQIEHLFSREMFYSHRNKQEWSVWGSGKTLVDRLVSSKGALDRHKQGSIYVGFDSGRISEPTRFRAAHAYRQLKYVLAAFEHIGPEPFYQVFDQPSPEIRKHVRNVGRVLRRHFDVLRAPRRIKRKPPLATRF